jgi:UDP-glucose 6-dehydrogenase
MEKKLNINVTDTANNIHKTCQEKIKELVDQIAEKDLKIEVIKEAVESKENQLKQGLRTISNYMEELEAKQIDIQDLQLQLQENFVPHEPQSLAAELDDTNSLDYSVRRFEHEIKTYSPNK